MEKYERLRELGRGSYGCAVLVRERQSRKQRVVKEIDLSRMPANAQREAKNEVEVLKSLSHPNIVAYCDSFMEGRSLCIVMEYADGGDLTALVKKRRDEKSPFSESEAVTTFSQCCLAIQHVHKKRILHRDLKCQNIFLTSAGDVKLGDFGIAKVLDHTAAQAVTMIGTPIYLAPEVCHSKPYGTQADVWSLGVVLYELLALEPPFTGANIASLINNIVTATPKPLSRSLYSEDLRDLVTQMLQKQPEKRPMLNQILSRSCIKRDAQTLAGWSLCDAGNDKSDDQTVLPGGARGVAKGSPDSLEEFVRQRSEDPRRRPPVPAAPRAEVVNEFKRNRDAALAAKARAEGRTPSSQPSSQQRHHSADAVPSSSSGYGGGAASRKAAEAERLLALQEAAAQARRDRRQVQQRHQELERADAAQRYVPSSPSDLPPARVRASSADHAKHLMDLQEAAAQARRDRRQIQQKVKDLERGGDVGNSDAVENNDETCLAPNLARGSSDSAAYGPSRERLSRQAAEAEHLLALQEARAQARQDRKVIDRMRKEQETSEVDRDALTRPESAPGGLRDSSNGSPRVSLAEKRASEAQHVQALNEAAAQARRDRKLLQQKMRQDQEQEVSPCPDAAESPTERASPAAKAEAKQLEEAQRRQALQEAAAQARRDRKLLQHKMRELEQEGEGAQTESNRASYSPLQREGSGGQESPSLRPSPPQDGAELDRTKPRSGSLGRLSPTLGLAGNLSLSRSRPTSNEPRQDIHEFGSSAALLKPSGQGPNSLAVSPKFGTSEDVAGAVDDDEGKGCADAGEQAAEGIPQIVIGLAPLAPCVAPSSDAGGGTLGSLSFSATVTMTGSSFTGTS